MKKALITGVSGQDGSYVAEFLLGQGYEVYNLVSPYAVAKLYGHWMVREYREAYRMFIMMENDIRQTVGGKEY